MPDQLNMIQFSSYWTITRCTEVSRLLRFVLRSTTVSTSTVQLQTTAVRPCFLGHLQKHLLLKLINGCKSTLGLYFHNVTLILLSETSYNRTPWSIVRRLEVVCENKSFTVTGILFPSKLGTMGSRRSGKWEKQGNYVNCAKEMYNNRVPNDTCGPCESERRSVGVKVYGSRHPMSKRTGDSGVAKIRKGRKTSRVRQPWGQRNGGDGRNLNLGGIRY